MASDIDIDAKGSPGLQGFALLRRLPLWAGLAGLAFLMIVPSGFVLYLGVMTARTTTAQLMESHASEYLSLVTQRIEQHLAPVGEQAGYVTRAIESGRADPANKPEFANFLRGALAALPHVHDLAFVYPDYRVIRVNRRSGEATERRWNDPDTRAMVLAAANRETPGWHRFFLVERTGEAMLDYRAPARRGDAFAGVLVAAVSVRDLTRYVTDSTLAPIRNAFLITDRGQLIAHSRFGGALAGRSDLQPLKTIDAAEDPVLEAFSRDGIPAVFEATSAPAMRSVTVESEAYLVAARSIEGYGAERWLAGLYIPLSTIDGAIGRINTLAIAGAAILILAVVTAMLLSERLMHPLWQFVASARALRQSDASGTPAMSDSVFREISEARQSLNALLVGVASLKSYLPENLTSRLLDSGREDALECEERDVTVLFTDIAGFTSLAAHLPPHAVAAFLNDHFALIGQCVEREDGTIDKYIGDSLMAFWGAPDEQPDHAERAFNAALDIASAIRKDNAERRAKGLDPVRMRIGLHSGPAIVGNIGAPGRVNYTVVGDTVNAAQRIEALGKRHSDRDEDVLIFLSEDVLSRIGEGMESFSIGKHALPGRYGEVEVFRLT